MAAHEEADLAAKSKEELIALIRDLRARHATPLPRNKRKREEDAPADDSGGKGDVPRRLTVRGAAPAWPRPHPLLREIRAPLRTSVVLIHALEEAAQGKDARYGLAQVVHPPRGAALRLPRLGLLGRRTPGRGRQHH